MKSKLSTLIFFVFLTLNLFAGEHDAGGQHTHKQKHDRYSFSRPSPLLSMDEKLDFKVGKAVFDKIWVFAPSSTTASDGLGPLYNARSCVRCHKGNGRGMIESGNSSSPALFLRLSVPASTQTQKDLLASGSVGFIEEPTYGKQLQTFAYPGGKAEGQLDVVYTEKRIQLSNSKHSVTLQAPFYTIKNLGYGSLQDNYLFSPRIAPPVFGLGLIDAIVETDILNLADPKDLDGDGISGKANIVWDELKQKSRLGRFGWKAGTPSLEQQNNAALGGDLGISSWMFPNHAGDCTLNQSECLQQKHGNMKRDKPGHDMLEASKKMTDLLLHYTSNIAVPPVRNINKPQRKQGKLLFTQAGCVKCHTPEFVTPNTHTNPRFANQSIWPYSDFLLHDMGEGLADNRPEYLANGREWRTPPLWGIGLTKTVSGNTFYLHDGRARNLMEAILWHGGEAEASKQKVVNMSDSQRLQLIFFLESL